MTEKIIEEMNREIGVRHREGMRDHFDDPRSEEMRDIDRRIKVVLDEAPSDSSVELDVVKTKAGYKALLKIYSLHTRFVGGSRAGRFADAIEEIFEEIRGQIRAWKERRALDRQS